VVNVSWNPSSKGKKQEIFSLKIEQSIKEVHNTALPAHIPINKYMW
jgi:hypothetical protein